MRQHNKANSTIDSAATPEYTIIGRKPEAFVKGRGASGGGDTGDGEDGNLDGGGERRGSNGERGGSNGEGGAGDKCGVGDVGGGGGGGTKGGYHAAGYLAISQPVMVTLRSVGLPGRLNTAPPTASPPPAAVAVQFEMVVLRSVALVDWLDSAPP